MSPDKNVKILVVDDANAMRVIITQMLNEAGFEEIIEAKDGKDAISKLEEEKPDLIISDWNMPNMGGLELLKWVRSNEKYRDIPFIMATAQGDKSKEEQVRKEKGNSHVAKPFESVQLIRTIKEVLGWEKAKKPKKKTSKVFGGKRTIRLGHIQITDHLTLGVLKHQIQTGKVVPKFFNLEIECMPGWNSVQKALENGEIDGAFILAPIAMDLFAFDVPIKLVSLAHKNGSSFVRNINYTTEKHESIADYYRKKVINIPHKMSIHNMLAHKYLSELGLNPGVQGDENVDVFFEVVPPIKMPGIMKEDKNVAGFIVAEPIASNAISKEIAELQSLSSTLWKNHPCCVVVLSDELISNSGIAVYELVSMLVKAGRFIGKNKNEAAKIAVKFLDPDKELGLTKDILLSVLNEPEGIKMNDLVPVVEDLDKIQHYMHNNMGIGKLIELEKFVDLKFINKAIKL